MHMRYWLTVSVCSVSIWACQSDKSGWTLKDTTKDVSLPDDFRNRVGYPDSSAVRDDLPDFVGHVIGISQNGLATKLTIDRLVLDDARPALKPIAPAAGRIYSSKIGKGFRAQLT